MRVKLDLSQFIDDERKFSVLKVKPKETRTVRDVINKIRQLFDVHNHDDNDAEPRLGLFEDEFYIHPDETAAVLEGSGVLKLKSLPESGKKGKKKKSKKELVPVVVLEDGDERKKSQKDAEEEVKICGSQLKNDSKDIKGPCKDAAESVTSLGEEKRKSSKKRKRCHFAEELEEVQGRKKSKTVAWLAGNEETQGGEKHQKKEKEEEESLEKKKQERSNIKLSDSDSSIEEWKGKKKKRKKKLEKQQHLSKHAYVTQGSNKRVKTVEEVESTKPWIMERNKKSLKDDKGNGGSSSSSSSEDKVVSTSSVLTAVERDRSQCHPIYDDSSELDLDVDRRKPCVADSMTDPLISHQGEEEGKECFVKKKRKRKHNKRKSQQKSDETNIPPQLSFRESGHNSWDAQARQPRKIASMDSFSRSHIIFSSDDNDGTSHVGPNQTYHQNKIHSGNTLVSDLHNQAEASRPTITGKVRDLSRERRPPIASACSSSHGIRNIQGSSSLQSTDIKDGGILYQEKHSQYAEKDKGLVHRRPAHNSQEELATLRKICENNTVTVCKVDSWRDQCKKPQDEPRPASSPPQRRAPPSPPHSALQVVHDSRHNESLQSLSAMKNRSVPKIFSGVRAMGVRPIQRSSGSSDPVRLPIANGSPGQTCRNTELLPADDPLQLLSSNLHEIQQQYKQGCEQKRTGQKPAQMQSLGAILSAMKAKPKNSGMDSPVVCHDKEPITSPTCGNKELNSDLGAPDLVIGNSNASNSRMESFPRMKDGIPELYCVSATGASKSLSQPIPARSESQMHSSRSISQDTLSRSVSQVSPSRLVFHGSSSESVNQANPSRLQSQDIPSKPTPSYLAQNLPSQSMAQIGPSSQLLSKDTPAQLVHNIIPQPVPQTTPFCPVSNSTPFRSGSQTSPSGSVLQNISTKPEAQTMPSRAKPQTDPFCPVPQASSFTPVSQASQQRSGHQSSLSGPVLQSIFSQTRQPSPAKPIGQVRSQNAVPASSAPKWPVDEVVDLEDEDEFESAICNRGGLKDKNMITTAPSTSVTADSEKMKNTVDGRKDLIAKAITESSENKMNNSTTIRDQPVQNKPATVSCKPLMVGVSTNKYVANIPENSDMMDTSDVEKSVASNSYHKEHVESLDEDEVMLDEDEVMLDDEEEDGVEEVGDDDEDLEEEEEEELEEEEEPDAWELQDEDEEEMIDKVHEEVEEIKDEEEERTEELEGVEVPDEEEDELIEELQEEEEEDEEGIEEIHDEEEEEKVEEIPDEEEEERVEDIQEEEEEVEEIQDEDEDADIYTNLDDDEEEEENYDDDDNQSDFDYEIIKETSGSVPKVVEKQAGHSTVQEGDSGSAVMSNHANTFQRLRDTLSPTKETKEFSQSHTKTPESGSQSHLAPRVSEPQTSPMLINVTEVTSTAKQHLENAPDSRKTDDSTDVVTSPLKTKPVASEIQEGTHTSADPQDVSDAAESQDAEPIFMIEDDAVDLIESQESSVKTNTKVTPVMTHPLEVTPIVAESQDAALVLSTPGKNTSMKPADSVKVSGPSKPLEGSQGEEVIADHQPTATPASTNPTSSVGEKDSRKTTEEQSKDTKQVENNICQSVIPPYNELPAMTAPPKAGDLIALRALVMEECYSFTRSDYQVAKVLAVDGACVKLKFVEPTSIKSLDMEDMNGEDLAQNTHIKEMDWRDVLEPRIIFSPS